jgi:hypothetical protein
MVWIASPDGQHSKPFSIIGYLHNGSRSVDSTFKGFVTPFPDKNTPLLMREGDGYRYVCRHSITHKQHIVHAPLSDAL